MYTTLPCFLVDSLCCLSSCLFEMFYVESQMFAADHHQILASRLILLTFLLVNHFGMQSPSVGLVYLYNKRIKPTFLKHNTTSQSINVKCNILSFSQKLPSMSFGLAHFNMYMSFLYNCKARMRKKETVNVKIHMRLSMTFLFPFFYHWSLTMRMFIFFILFPVIRSTG